MIAAVDELLNKPVSRKEFLQHVGAGFLLIIGLSGLIKAIMNNGAKPQSKGYGSSSYGR